MAASTPVSLDEYLSTVYDPDCECVDGEVLERDMGDFDHSGIQSVVNALLFGQRRQQGIHVFSELR